MRAVTAFRKTMAALALALTLLCMHQPTGYASENTAWGPDPAAIIVDDNGLCANLKQAPTAITVDLLEAPTVVDNNKPWAELINNSQFVRQLGLEKAKVRELWSVNDLESAGMAYGGLDSMFTFELSKESVDKYGAYYCVLFKTVSVQLLYRTMVSIPSDFAPDSCAYAVINTHEQMVLDANKQAIETYVDRLRQDIPGIIEHLEIGYSSRNTVSTRETQMKSDIQQAIDIYLKDTLPPKIKQMISIVNTPEELALRKTALENCKKQLSGKGG